MGKCGVSRHATHSERRAIALKGLGHGHGMHSVHVRVSGIPLRIGWLEVLLTWLNLGSATSLVVLQEVTFG